MNAFVITMAWAFMSLTIVSLAKHGHGYQRDRKQQSIKYNKLKRVIIWKE